MSGKKRTSLEAVFRVDEPPADTSRDVPAIADRKRSAKSKPRHPETTEGEGGALSTPKRPSVKQHTAYLPIPVHEQLRKLAFEENRKIHDYLIEGLDRVFSNRGLASVEDLV